MRAMPSGPAAVARERVVRFLAAQSPICRSDIDAAVEAPSDLTSAVMRRALLQHTEGVTVRLVRLIEALAFPRPHGKTLLER
jgi:hypothetical protein